MEQALTSSKSEQQLLVKKERPILFSAPMVKAILDGRKTQTRRVFKDVPDWINDFGFSPFTPLGSISGRGTYLNQGPAEKFYKLKYGKPGDLLWVRETFQALQNDDGTPALYYKATDKKQEHVDLDDEEIRSQWKPSIHMPRWASRINLEIINVRVEKLHEITPDDVLKEGIEFHWDNPKGRVLEFCRLWDSINGEGEFRKNPWVWVIEFKRVK